MNRERLKLLVEGCDICLIDGCSLYHGYDDILVSQSTAIIIEPSQDRLCEVRSKYPDIEIINGLLSNKSEMLQGKFYSDDNPDFVNGKLIACSESNVVLLGIEELLVNRESSKAAVVLKRNRVDLLGSLTPDVLNRIDVFLLCDFEELDLSCKKYLLANGFVLENYTNEKFGYRDYLFLKSSFISKVKEENFSLKKGNEKITTQIKELERQNIKLALDIKYLRKKYLNTTTDSFISSNKQGMILRVLRHFACSGGTLYSKCLSAMPNSFLLSEVYPFNPFPASNPVYSPTNLAELMRHSGFPELEECQSKVFSQSILQCHKHIEQYGGSLILREHTHADYCVGDEVKYDTVGSTLAAYFDRIINVVTVRNPIDSYLSLVHNKWLHFFEPNFENYCNRLKQFTDKYSDEEIYLYEDFVENPKDEMKSICDRFEIEYSEVFINIFDIFKVTGDSGRKSDSISPRKRRTLDDEFKKEIQASISFKQLCQRDIFNRYKELPF